MLQKTRTNGSNYWTLKSLYLHFSLHSQCCVLWAPLWLCWRPLPTFCLSACLCLVSYFSCFFLILSYVVWSICFFFFFQSSIFVYLFFIFVSVLFLSLCWPLLKFWCLTGLCVTSVFVWYFLSRVSSIFFLGKFCCFFLFPVSLYLSHISLFVYLELSIFFSSVSWIFSFFTTYLPLIFSLLSFFNLAPNVLFLNFCVCLNRSVWLCVSYCSRCSCSTSFLYCSFSLCHVVILFIKWLQPWTLHLAHSSLSLSCHVSEWPLIPSVSSPASVISWTISLYTLFSSYPNG